MILLPALPDFLRTLKICFLSTYISTRAKLQRKCLGVKAVFVCFVCLFGVFCIAREDAFS